MTFRLLHRAGLGAAALLFGSSPLPAAVIAFPFGGNGPTFHSGGTGEELLIPLILPGIGSSSLWLSQGGPNAHLVSEGPLKVAITQSSPPNIGGLVRAMDAGEIIGGRLAGDATWFAGEAVNPDTPGLKYHILYLAQLTPYAVSEFFKPLAYIGLEFEIAGQVHYGWLSVETPLDGSSPPGFEPYRSRLTGFAYETEAGVAIVAGVVPEPLTPLLFASSLGGLFVRSRKPKKPAVEP